MKSKASKCFSGLTVAIMSTTLIVVFIFCPSNEPRLPTIRSTHIVYESNSNLQAYGLDSTDISRSRQLGYTLLFTVLEPIEVINNNDLQKVPSIKFEGKEIQKKILLLSTNINGQNLQIIPISFSMKKAQQLIQ